MHVQNRDIGETVVKDSLKQQSAQMFKCYECEEDFDNKPLFMEHKKTMHQNSLKPCQKFVDNECLRSADDCWFQHPQPEPYKKQDFPQAQINPFPPDQVIKMAEMLTKLHKTVENLELKLDSYVKKMA